MAAKVKSRKRKVKRRVPSRAAERIDVPVSEDTPDPQPLRITVVNGDLTYVSKPLLIGHYRSSKLSGAEAFMDRVLGYAMSASLERGLYPSAAGTHQVFLNTRHSPDNPWQLPRPEAVIVAGLGAEGELRGTDLVTTVRQAVIAWGQRLTELTPVPSAFSLAATLLGSGGTGISAGQAAQLIAQGVREANDQVSSDRNKQGSWPQVSDLHVIELYLDRATEAWRSLDALASGSPGLYTVNAVIEKGIGALRRPPDGGYRGAEYDFISALVQKSEDSDEHIVYTIDSKRARSEVRAQAAQLPLIKNLVATASNSANTDERIGRTLFNLLVPVDLESFMGSSGATVIQVDSGTASIPWELLDTATPGGGDDRPWAIRTTLLRKLRTDASSRVVNDASADDSVLVIGDPACDRTRYLKLYGARREAAAVAACLSAEHAGRSPGQSETAPYVTSLISPDFSDESDGVEPDANAILNEAMSRAWRIVHIAGHGEPPLVSGQKILPRGVVLSNESFFGPVEIGALRAVPELVFVNCCHLASADERLLLKERNYDRAQFASGVAEALIHAGVRCVVAAGWAIDDEAALVFAKTFYTKLLGGARFIEAVASARSASRDAGGNTWAAYQCYGDPDWQYRRGTGDAQRPSQPPPAQELAGIPSAVALVIALDTLAVRSEFQNAKPEEQAARLTYLETEPTLEPLRNNNGEVAEAFGNAWAKSGNFDKAIAWFERARIAQDGSASLAAVEQLANAKVRRAWQQVEQSGPGDKAARARAREDIAEAMSLLDCLLVVGPTAERQSLYGSAYKRLALIEGAEGRVEKEIEAIAKMRDHYAAAEQIATSIGKIDFYPAMNRLAAQLALDGGTQRAAIDPDALGMVQLAMHDAPADFWSVVGQTELRMYGSLFRRTLAKDVGELVRDFEGHFSRVSAPRRWASVLDSASFVLLKYKKRASAQEALAADRLLGRLAELAGRSPAPEASVKASRRRRGYAG